MTPVADLRTKVRRTERLQAATASAVGRFPWSPNVRRAGLAGLVAVACLAGCAWRARDAVTVPISVKRETPNVAKATLLVDYTRSGAKIMHEAGQPSCAFILPGLSGNFTDDGRGTLTVHLQAKHGLRGPADVVACRMLGPKSDEEADQVASRMEVKVTEAEDGAGKVIDLTATAAASAVSANSAADAAAGQTDAAAGEGEENTGEATAPRAERPRASRPAKTTAAVTTAPGAHKAPPTAAPATPSRPVPVAPPRPATTPPGATRGAVLAPSVQAQRQTAGNAGDSAVPIPSGSGRDPDYDDSPGDQPNAPTYDVTVSVDRTAVNLGALQFTLSHTGSSGGWVGRGGAVDCQALVNAMQASNWPGGRSAQIGLISVQGIRTPGPVVRCSFRSREYVSPGSFAVEVIDASDTNSVSLKPPPPMRVSSVIRR